MTLGVYSTTTSAIELTDFTDPDTQYEEAYIDFTANANDGNQDQISYEENLLYENTLSALGVVKMDDVLFDEPISSRRHGWLVRAGVGMQLSDFSGTVDSDPMLRFEFEYAKPFGLTGQLLETASYEPVFGDDTVHRLANRLSYTYEISDRIDWLNAWDMSYQQVDDTADSRFVSNSLSSTFLYHLTNELDLALTLAANDVDIEPEPVDADDKINTSAVLGIRYRSK